MALLAPLFLAAGLAVALPIWLHRLNVQNSNREPFSSTMLLEATEQQVHVRKQIRYRMLLALRVAGLAILALAFAQPLYSRSVPAGSGSRSGSHLVLIDASASMRRAGAAAAARDAANAVIDAIPATDIVQLATADGRIQVISEPATAGQPGRSGSAAIAAFEPGLERLDYGVAMASAGDLARRLPPPVTLHVISDFQQSGMPVRFSELVPENVAVIELYPVVPITAADWRIDSVTADADSATISIAGEAGPARLRVRLNDRPLVDSDIVDAVRERIELDTALLEPGDNRLVIALDTRDDQDANNRAYRVISNAPPEPVPLVTADPASRSITYLEAVLAADTSADYSLSLMPIGNTDYRTLARYPWALIDDIGSLPPDVAAVLAGYVEGGGSLLAFAGPAARGLERIPVTGHAVQPTAVGAVGDGFLAPTSVASAHPALARTEGWQAVNVSRNLSIEPGPADRVLIRLDDGTPFLVEQRRGEGRILLVTAGLENDWNDLPVRPVFVGFMGEAARYLSGAETLRRAYRIGDVLTLALIEGRAGQVLDPSGQTVLALADTMRAQQVRLNQPGFYEVYTPRAQYLVAVNVDPRESDPSRIADTTLDRWRQSVTAPVTTVRASGSPPAPTPVELWPVLLALLAALVIGESLLGNRYFRPQATGKA